MTELHLVVARTDILLERLIALARDRRWLTVSWLLALGVHTGVAALLMRGSIPLRPPLRPPELSFELEPEVPVPQPKAEVRPDATPPATPAAHAWPPKIAAASAHAANILQQSAAPEQPVDFSDAIVTGTSATFAGGTTTSTGQDARPGTVSNPFGSPATSGDSQASPSSIDRSRAARIAGGFNWNCPFPDNSEAEGVDRAVATIRIQVDAAGRTGGVSIVSDPGHGFGEAARRCASGRRWNPALDRAGNVSASSVLVAVRFVR